MAENEEPILGKRLEALALAMVEEVETESLSKKLEVFKTIIPWYVGTRRLGKKNDEPDDGVPSLASMKEAVNGVE